MRGVTHSTVLLTSTAGCSPPTGAASCVHPPRADCFQFRGVMNEVAVPIPVPVFCGQKHPSLLGTRSEGESLGPGVDACSALLETIRKLSRVVVLLTLPRAVDERPCGPAPLPTPGAVVLFITDILGGVRRHLISTQQQCCVQFHVLTGHADALFCAASAHIFAKSWLGCLSFLLLLVLYVFWGEVPCPTDHRYFHWTSVCFFIF